VFDYKLVEMKVNCYNDLILSYLYMYLHPFEWTPRRMDATLEIEHFVMSVLW
jgi:hypothetical protein